MPEEYQKCYTQINQVLKKTWEIVDKTADERTRLQALGLIDQCNTHRMDMVTNGTIVKDALNYVNNNTKELNSSAEKKLLQNIKDKGMDDAEAAEVEDEAKEETATTTHAIF